LSDFFIDREMKCLGRLQSAIGGLAYVEG